MPDSEETGKEQAVRGPGGVFARGISGNPRGRPRGSRNRVSRAALDLLDSNSEAIMRKLIEQAQAGEALALRLCVERIVPKRDRVVELDVPKLLKLQDVASAAARVIELAAAGDISLEEARGFLGLLKQHREALESGDLQVRVEALEGASLAQWVERRKP